MNFVTLALFLFALSLAASFMVRRTTDHFTRQDKISIRGDRGRAKLRNLDRVLNAAHHEQCGDLNQPQGKPIEANGVTVATS